MHQCHNVQRIFYHKILIFFKEKALASKLFGATRLSFSSVKCSKFCTLNHLDVTCLPTYRVRSERKFLEMNGLSLHLKPFMNDRTPS